MSFRSPKNRFFTPGSEHPIQGNEPAWRWLKTMKEEIDLYLDGDDTEGLVDPSYDDAIKDFPETSEEFEDDESPIVIAHCIKHLKGAAHEAAVKARDDEAFMSLKEFFDWFKQNYCIDNALVLFREAQQIYQTSSLEDYNRRFGHLRVRNMFCQNAVPESILYDIYISHLSNPKFAEVLRQAEWKTGHSLRNAIRESKEILENWGNL
ncbi:hypothetical protein JCM33374_g453 [Metschnikowia sp. JCM 33374]|nr:hypothetical protein JCM33374_g453 [Metschnikowia sp. JCM 33374]